MNGNEALVAIVAISAAAMLFMPLARGLGRFFAALGRSIEEDTPAVRPLPARKDAPRL